MPEPVLDLPDSGFIPMPLVVLHAFDQAFAHFFDFINHEAGTPESNMVIAMAKGFAAAHGVDPALVDEGGKVVTAAMEFARTIAQENAAASVKSTTLTITPALTVTQEPAQ